jgi:UDP-N-acetylmuramoyl-L-alanyl-D-glutamate--2,6-diaminopimelate ligase
MAEVAEKFSDLVVLTNDNPRTESAEIIIDDIKQGISKDLQLIVEMDRSKAIQQAINIATVNDLVLIAGKGHEQFQIIGDEKFAFSDKAVALSVLEVTQ